MVQDVAATEIEQNTDSAPCSSEVDPLVRSKRIQGASGVFSGPLHLCKRFVKAVWNGPTTPRDPPPHPIKQLRLLESLPGRFRHLVPRYWRVAVLVVYMTVWLVIWGRVMMPYYTQPPQVDGVPIVSLGCGKSRDFWIDKNLACGLDANLCPSFNTESDVVFRCPALCDRGSWLYSLRAVGAQVVNYRGFYVGGGKTPSETLSQVLTQPYRADSYPCGAAIHAGEISSFTGGCVRASYLSGAQPSFPPAPGAHGESIGFPSFFPKSFVFVALLGIVGPCRDPRLVVMLLNIFMGAQVVFFAPPAVFYWVLSTVGHWTVALATDPPVKVDPLKLETLAQLVSVALGRFLPTCFVLHVVWLISAKRTFLLEQPGSQPETARDKYLLWYSPVLCVVLWHLSFWVGVLSDLTFDRLPIDRLTLRDLKTMPGAVIAMAVLLSVTIVCVVAQTYYIWRLGRLWKFVKFYLVLGGLLAVLALLPGLTLRIHHYIFALIFIPASSTRGWTAYVFQGLLLGLFLSGVAHWGYTSIAETPFMLLRGEPLSVIVAPLVDNCTAGVLYWLDPDGTPFGAMLNDTTYVPMLNDTGRYTEISLLVNDVERHRGPDSGLLNVTDIIESNSSLKQLVEMALAAREDPASDISLFLRLARYSPRPRKYGDYTHSSVLRYPSMDWTPAPPGHT